MFILWEYKVNKWHFWLLVFLYGFLLLSFSTFFSHSFKQEPICSCSFSINQIWLSPNQKYENMNSILFPGYINYVLANLLKTSLFFHYHQLTSLNHSLFLLLQCKYPLFLLKYLRLVLLPRVLRHCHFHLLMKVSALFA